MFDSAKIVFGPGFEVQKVVTGFESRAVILPGLPVDVNVDAIRNALEPFGEVADVQVVARAKDASKVTAKAFYTDHASAAQAAAALDGSNFFGTRLSIQLATHKSTSLGKGTVCDGDIDLEFSAPSRTGFAGYPSLSLAQQAIEAATRNAVLDCWIAAEIHNGIPKVGSVTVRFQHLPPNFQARDFEKFGKNQGVMLTKPNYMRLERALENLHDLLQRFGEMETLNVSSPPYPRGLVRAWVHFKSADAADRLCNELHGRGQRFLGGERLYVHHVRSVKYRLPREVYKALCVDIRLLRSYACSRDARSDIVVVDRNDPVIVKLVANELPVLSRLKSAYETLLRGDIVKHNGEVIWDPFFDRSFGAAYLRELQNQHPGLIIERNLRRRVISLFGPPHSRRLVKEAILAQLSRLRSLKSQSFPIEGHLISLFMSADLAKLQEELGHENVVFNLAKQTLLVRGNEDAFQVARLAIRHTKQRCSGPRKHLLDACPVCFDEATSPVTLRCSHTWCKSCLRDYLLASIDNKVFPLSCLGNEAKCAHLIPLEVAREVLTPKEFDTILTVSSTAYVHLRPSEFHYCPTPDCPQIYRSAPKDTVLQCPSCLVRICPHCHVEYHEGSVCPDRDREDRKLFEEWVKDHDVKNCPHCKAPIERAAGCNHMNCARCKTHICWVCLQTFSGSKEVYDHMHDTHGGIGL
ncbi:unnamed protein product [Somion occarium]|uniref:Uncharacterized protein n=1 Tax=Somion occarium TaxID=3059160 RepID=A0ABP1DMP4_9APHY